MESPRDSAEIIDGIGQLRPDSVGDAVLSLPDDERTVLARELLPTRDELQAHIDEVSDPDSSSYDPDLAN